MYVTDTTTTAPVNGSTPERHPDAIADAILYTSDRLDRIEHVLGDLNGVVMRLGSDLGPVLTDGTYEGPMSNPETTPADPAYDRRSTLAQNITRLGDRADRLATATAYVRDLVGAIAEALELGGLGKVEGR